MINTIVLRTIKYNSELRVISTPIIAAKQIQRLATNVDIPKCPSVALIFMHPAVKMFDTDCIDRISWSTVPLQKKNQQIYLLRLVVRKRYKALTKSKLAR